MVFMIGLLDRVGENVPANMPPCTFSEGFEGQNAAMGRNRPA